MLKAGGSFPSRHFRGAENISLPKIHGLFWEFFGEFFGNFHASYLADHQLHSPRARYLLGYKPRMVGDQDRFVVRLFGPPGGGEPTPMHKDRRDFLVCRPCAAVEAAAEPVAAEDTSRSAIFEGGHSSPSWRAQRPGL
eukprot:365143-Chlamydomonas_euryale.AAC.5